MENYIRIAKLDNEVEGELIASILTDRGIPFALHRFHDSAFDGLFELTEGWGMVEGPENRRDEILELLEGLRQEPAADGESE